MPAPTIQITVDGETPIQLNTPAGPILVTQYNQAAPEVMQDAVAVNRDRNDLGVPSWQNVSESLELVFVAATPATVQGWVWQINAALDRARQSRRTWGGTRVWLEVQHAADSETWRSEILAGSLQTPNGVNEINRNRLVATLAIVRRPYWEGALAPVLLTTAQTGETTLPVTLYNSADAGGATVRNWINIGATRIAGELPTPLKLSVINGETADQSWAQVYTCNYAFMDAATVDPVLLGSEAIDGASESWGGDGEAKLCRFPLTQAQLADFAGQYCRVLVNLTAATVNMWLRVRVDFSPDGTTFSTLYYAPAQVRYQTGGLIDVGCVPLPPFGFNQSSAFVYVALTGQLVGGWSATVGHMQICPTGHGLFRRLDIGGDALTILLQDNDTIVDDGPEDRAYAYDDSAAADWPVVRPYYAPLLAWPGRVNRLRVLVRSGTAFPADIVLKAQAWHRPRRLSV